MKIDFSHLWLLLKRLSIGFLVFTLCRFLFYLFHLSFFSGNFPADAFFYGIRFDFVAISYLFSPFILLSMVPFGFRSNPRYQIAVKAFFHLANSLAIILNLIDLGYYQYALKRSTADLFNFLNTGNDFWGMLPQYLVDFWYAFLFLVLLIVFSEFLYRKTTTVFQKTTYTLKSYGVQFALFILVISFTIIGFRGGTQLKPLDIINAGNHTSPQFIPVVLNTPFCVLKTVLNDQLSSIDFFEENEVEKKYSPTLNIQSQGVLQGKNVVFIILESFAKEYVGFFNQGKGYTPFIDSLCEHSYVFTNAYSNGSKSIEALPSIFAGLPPLMNTPYVISNYSSNQLDALPQLLKNNGYNTSFYHGGANGTMGFDGFVKTCGVDNYYGKDEYPDKEKDDDHHWGIYDEPYLQYYANELSTKKQPFFSTVFTLSSHHPYTLPKKYKDVFPEGELKAHPTIGYTDYALRMFFKSARNKDWFKNTVFVFTADHSASSIDPKYATIIGRFAIPVFIYDPSGTLQGMNDNYFQHCDLTPTILELLGINTSIVSFGLPLSTAHRHIVGFSRNTYYYMSDEYLLLFDGKNTLGLYSYKEDSLLTNNLLNILAHKNIQTTLEQQLKAIIQQHNNRLINNQLSAHK